jgi:hypothetical protein
MTSFTPPNGLPSADTTGIPIKVEARCSADVLVGTSGVASVVVCDADACEAAGGGVSSSEGTWSWGTWSDGAAAVEDAAPCALGELGGGAIAADAGPCSGVCAEVGASAVENGSSDWLHEAAARPSAAQTSGRMILIIGVLQICGLQAAYPSSTFDLTI